MLIQFAALPFRFHGEKGLQILLITSRDTRRWVIPRGNPMPRLKGHETAAREAYEEAGLEGQLLELPIGHYLYDKSRQHDDRDVRRLRHSPEPAADLDSRHPFDHPVEDDDVRRRLPRDEQGILAVGRRLDLEFLAAKVEGQKLDQRRVVLDEQDPCLIRQCRLPRVRSGPAPWGAR